MISPRAAFSRSVRRAHPLFCFTRALSVRHIKRDRLDFFAFFTYTQNSHHKKGNFRLDRTRMLEMERIRVRILHENKECVLSVVCFSLETKL